MNEAVVITKQNDDHKIKIEGRIAKLKKEEWLANKRIKEL